jgi:uncharacterized protein
MRHAKLLCATLTASLMLVALAGAAVAGPLEDATAAYHRGDYATALGLVRPLADQGERAAQYNLGVMYAKGLGVPQNHTEAFKWLRRAANQGYAHAQNSIGVMFADGLGVPQDYVQAHMWLDLAASRYPDSGKEDRDKAIKARDLVASKMTPAQIAEAQKLAGEWKPKPER